MYPYKRARTYTRNNTHARTLVIKILDQNKTKESIRPQSLAVACHQKPCKPLYPYNSKLY